MHDSSVSLPETIASTAPNPALSASGAANGLNFQQALQKATTRLTTEAGMPAEDARREARILLQLATGASREMQLQAPETMFESAAWQRFQHLLVRRLQHEPMAYLAGEKEFFGRNFAVSPATLIPRPDSEILVETALACLPVEAPAKVLDLGTGTGCLLLSLLAERRMAQGLGVDVQPQALELCAMNAEALGVANRLELACGDWWEALPHSQCFDLILSNPPYISTTDMQVLMPDVLQYEPESALHGGEDGLDAYRIICARAAEFLVPGGLLLFEIGYTQAASVTALGQNAGLEALGTCADLAGHPRVVGFRKSGAHAALIPPFSHLFPSHP